MSARADRSEATRQDFSVANLPFGVADGDGWSVPHVVVAIGDDAVDCDALQRVGTFDDLRLEAGVFATGSLNELFALGREVVGGVRRRVRDALDRAERRPRSQLQLRLPIEVADYVDFYSSEHHARNLGNILRPGEEPLAPNWKQIPVGYHGRAGSVVVSGTDVARPCGMVADGDSVTYAPSRKLDIELEVGAIAGAPSAAGRPVAVGDAEDHVVGLVLLNDWSARDIQAYEYRPLGPNLGKSFATSISPWVVTLDALAPFRVDGPVQDPEPQPHLVAGAGRNIGLRLEVAIRTAAMRDAGDEPEIVATTDFGGMYWSIGQQVAHLTSNGARLRTGDLLGSGTVSGPMPGECGSLIELAELGSFENGFLQDGDEVILRGWAGDGEHRVGFGELSGTIRPALVPVAGAH